MNKNIGISSFCHITHPLGEALDLIVPLSRTVEIVDGGLHTLNRGNIEVLGSYDLSLSIHAPVSDVNIGSVFEPTRKASIEILESRFRIASDFSASLVIHPGHVSWESDRPLAQRQLTRSIRDLIPLQEEYDVRFYIENLLNWHSSLVKTPKDLHLIRGASLALDIGHAHTCGCLSEFLTMPCEYYHIHDNDGINDQHLSLGKGTIEMRELVTSLKRDNARMILEMNTPQDVTESREYLLGVFS